VVALLPLRVVGRLPLLDAVVVMLSLAVVVVLLRPAVVVAMLLLLGEVVWFQDAVEAEAHVPSLNMP
jgi:hypothetical protein